MEVWYGQAAVDKNLCDDISTKDDIILDYVNDSYDVYSVKFEEPKDERGGLRDLLPVGAHISENIGRERMLDGVVLGGATEEERVRNTAE